MGIGLLVMPLVPHLALVLFWRMMLLDVIYFPPPSTFSYIAFYTLMSLGFALAVSATC